MSEKTQIFCFHRISDEFSPAYPPIPIKVFDKICAFINRKYLVIPLDGINDINLNKKPRAIITFDDGYYDFYENALPILIKYKMPAVQHVITSCAETGESFWTQKLNKTVEAYFFSKNVLYLKELNLRYNPKSSSECEKVALDLYLKLLIYPKRDALIDDLYQEIDKNVEFTRMMRWHELAECAKNNISIGSHTHNHINLKTADSKELFFELECSRELIKDNIKSQNCDSLAFPNGLFNEQVIGVAKSSGYKFLFSTEPNSILFSKMPVVLPRISLYHQLWWKNYLKLIISYLS